MRSLRTLALLIAIQQPSLALPQQSQSAQGQLSQPNPMTRALRLWWGIADYIVQVAEAMPEDKYSFKPFADMRSFGDEIGHVADEHYLRCSQVRGEAPPAKTVEGKVARKDDLVSKLKESVAYCNAVYEGMTDTNLSTSWQQGDTRGINLGPLVANIAHDNEHWGILIMLMRISGVAPPRLQ